MGEGASTSQNGMLALNTEQARSGTSRNRDDPMCNPVYQEMAAQMELPLAHRQHTALLCRISGALMDSENPPMVLPNGQVFSHDALWRMHQEAGEVRCPVTGDCYAWAQLKKAFIL